MINGVSSMIMTKPDVLSVFDEIKVCVAYKVDGKETQEIPYNVKAEIEPVYKTFKGWKRDIGKIRNFEDLPAELKTYIAFIEKETGVSFGIISVGPDRSETIVRI